jgi:hypothetical protein
MFSEVTGLAVVLDQCGFKIEEVEMAGGSGHEELDDAFGAWRVMQGLGVRSRADGEGVVVAEERGEGDAAQSAAGIPQELPSCERMPVPALMKG